MAQQSSTVTVLRAVVMLVCLIAIPLAALFGSSLPGMVKAIQEGRWPMAKTAAASQKTLGDAVPFVPSSPPKSPAAAGAPMPIDFKAFGQPYDSPTSPPGVPNPNANERGGSAVVQAGFDLPVKGAMNGPAVIADRDLPEGAAARLRRLDAGAAKLSPIERGGDERREALAADRTPANADPFNQIHDRLRQLGATYYLLESWGGQQQFYRFYCKMAVGGNSNYTRYFEAYDSEPLRAMTQVLSQVEAWRLSKM